MSFLPRGFATTLRRFDPLVALPLAILLALGPILIAACGEDYEDLVPRQLVWIGIGLTLAVPLMLVPYGQFLGLGPLGYGVGVVSLVLVRGFAPEINGSRRWFLIGDFQVQPSEFMKLAVVLCIAWVLRHGKPLVEEGRWIKVLALCLVPSGLVLIQPDLGMSLLFLPIGLAVLVSEGLPLRRLALILCCGALLGTIGFRFGLAEYQQERIASTYRFERLTPAQRWNTAYQLTQSYARIASGGLTGASEDDLPAGLEGGLPHRHNDFIFAVMAQRGGFLGALVLLVVHAALVLAIFGVAARTRDPAGRTLCVGIAAWFLAQGGIHAAVAVGLAPTKGMPLPFVSYGGSSMLVSMFAIGLVQNVAMHPVRLAQTARRFTTVGRGSGARS